MIVINILCSAYCRQPLLHTDHRIVRVNDQSCCVHVLPPPPALYPRMKPFRCKLAHALFTSDSSYAGHKSGPLYRPGIQMQHTKKYIYILLLLSSPVTWQLMLVNAHQDILYSSQFEEKKVSGIYYFTDIQHLHPASEIQLSLHILKCLILVS